MTPQPPLARRLVLLVVAALLLATPVAGAEDDATDPWVAKVGGRTLYLSRLAEVVAWRMRSRLKEAGSGPTTVLRQMVQELAVVLEARRLGVTVPEEAVLRKWNELDTEVRSKTGGTKNLEEAIREQRSTKSEFMAHLRHQLLKEAIAGHPDNLGDTLPLPSDPSRRLAQTEVVITKVLKRTDVKYGWQTSLPQAPDELVEVADDLPRNVVATVAVYADELPGPGEPEQPGTPITVERFGEELVRRLPSTEIREIIEEECKAALTTQVALSVEDMTEVIEKEKENWNEWREMASQEAYRHLSYEDYVRMRYRLDLEQMRTDRYYRGLFGLILQEREKITPEQVRAEWEREKDGLYGDAILVTDLEILFSPQNPLTGSRGGRDRKEALKIANDLLRTIGTGVDFEKVTSDINARRDQTLRARRIRVHNSGTGRLLFEKAKDMKDGQISRPFETLSEVHVLRREEFIPAPAYEDVKETILEGMAKRNAHTWLEEQLVDEEQVTIRWPLP